MEQENLHFSFPWKGNRCALAAMDLLVALKRVWLGG